MLEGKAGAQLGDEVRITRPGDLAFKPRNVPHAFCNPGARERLPRKIRAVFQGERPATPPRQRRGPPDVEALVAIMTSYGLEMDFGSIPVLAERYGLVVNEPPPA